MDFNFLINNKREDLEMGHTETFFGLQNINGKISADNGDSFLPKYADMTGDEFESLVFDIEWHVEAKLGESDIEQLKEILK